MNVISAPRNLSNESIEMNFNRPPRARRQTVNEEFPRMTKELMGLLQFQNNMNLRLGPGETKRTRRPTIATPPATPRTARKKYTKKRAMTPASQTPRRAVTPPNADLEPPAPQNNVRAETPEPPAAEAPGPPSANDVVREMMQRLQEGIAQKTQNGQDIIRTANYEFSRFPEVANYFSCHSTRQIFDPNITFCKLAPSTGIIHMAPRTTRKPSHTELMIVRLL